jgi:hypothetical protein
MAGLKIESQTRATTIHGEHYDASCCHGFDIDQAESSTRHDTVVAGASPGNRLAPRTRREPRGTIEAGRLRQVRAEVKRRNLPLGMSEMPAQNRRPVQPYFFM